MLFTTTSGIETLTKNGKVIAGTGTLIASSGMGVAVLKGAPKPDISTPEKFKQALLAAKAVAYTDPASGGASGLHFTKVLERLGIAKEINAKAKLGSGVPSASFVVKGEADIAIQQIPELLGVQGVELVGPLPGDLQNVTPFAGGVHVSSANPDAGRALIKFLQTPEAAAVFKARGLNPARGSHHHHQVDAVSGVASASKIFFLATSTNRGVQRWPAPVLNPSLFQITAIRSGGIFALSRI